VQQHPFAWIYADRRWRQLRASTLQEHPCCELCGRLAQCADHRVPHRGNENLAFDPKNLRSLCNTCHGRVTAGQTMNRGGGRKVLKVKDLIFTASQDDARPCGE
jgi:5-methylcytosine-specific restriction endonuclease McrA